MRHACRALAWALALCLSATPLAAQQNGKAPMTITPAAPARAPAARPAASPPTPAGAPSATVAPTVEQVNDYLNSLVQLSGDFV